MSALVRCKACGYIMKAEKVGEVCPACGLKSKVFEPYEDKVSPRRRFLLDLDAHPILVHFPQAFASILPPLIVLNFVLDLLFPGQYVDQLRHVIVFTALVLPVTCAGAIASGLFDARLKLKKLTTPALLRKIAAGVGMLVFSSANTALILLRGFGSETRIFVLALALACLMCAVLLGMMGKRLIPVILPGK